MRLYLNESGFCLQVTSIMYIRISGSNSIDEDSISMGLML